MGPYTHGAAKFDPPVKLADPTLRTALLLAFPMLNEETRERLKQRLDQVHTWPSVYMFKFIFEPDKDRLDKVLALFPPESEVLRRYSTGGKYLSITAREVMMSAEEVVERYDRASGIQGVIVL